MQRKLLLRALAAASAVTALLAASTASASVTIGTTTFSSPSALPGSFAAGATLAIGDIQTNTSTAATLTFYDSFVFTLSAPVNLSLLSTSIQLLPAASITGLTERLFSGSTLTFTSTTTDPFAGLTALATSTTGGLSYTNLAAGTYTLEFTGVLGKATSLLGVTVPTVGTYGALVGLAAAAAPVPEPGTLGLLAAGLAAIGVVAARRRATV
jgi:hypothetical protein